MSPRTPSGVACAPRLEIVTVPGLPVIAPGDDLGAIVGRALDAADFALRDGDVVAVASKLVSRAEGRFVSLASVVPSARAEAIATRAGKDPRIAELVLREAIEVSRVTRGAIIVRHRLGFISANAGIDQSNAGLPGASPDEGPWALLLPLDPDASASLLQRALTVASGAAIGVVVTDSFGRPFRLGTVGAAIGVAGLPALWDQRGGVDLFGRVLEQTVTALADQVAAAADLVLGQADEARGAVVVRGLRFPVGAHSARELVRPTAEDLYARSRDDDPDA